MIWLTEHYREWWELMDLRGQRIQNRYLLGALLGEGVDALVYCAMDCHLGRTVAIKLLRPELTADPTLVTRFEREARGASRLNHPNVVPVYDYGKALDTYYLVMEYVRGGSLSQHLRPGQPLSREAALEIATPIADALGAAHARGVVHRDVKPANILLTEEGCPKLTDFGIAKLLDIPAVTRASALMGTADYLAPEQATGGEITPATDVYALGVVLYEMLAGRRPFVGRGLLHVAMQHVHIAPPPLTRLNPAVPASLAGVVARSLAKDPALRFEDGAALAAALRAETRQRQRQRPTTVVIVPSPAPAPPALPASPSQFAAEEPPAALPPVPNVRSYALRQRGGVPAKQTGMVAAGLGLMLTGLLTAGTLHGDPASPVENAWPPASESALAPVPAALVVPPPTAWEQGAKSLITLEDAPVPVARPAAASEPVAAGAGAAVAQAPAPVAEPARSSAPVAEPARSSVPPTALTGSADSPRSAPSGATMRVASVADRSRPAPAAAPTLGTAAPVVAAPSADEDVQPAEPPAPPAAVEAPPAAPPQAEQPKPRAADPRALPMAPWGMPPPPMLGPWGPAPPVLVPVPPPAAHRQVVPSAVSHGGARR